MKKRFVCICLIFSLITPLFLFDISAEDVNTLETLTVPSERVNEEYVEEVALLSAKIESYIKTKSVARSTSGKQLSVPLYQQANDFYCGPASVQMVLRYLTGTTYAQSTLANSMNTSRNGGTYVYCITDELNSRTSSGNYQHLQTYNVSFSNGLVYSIDKNKPVICHVMTGALPNYNYSVNTGHYIVATGYYVAYSGSSGAATCKYNDPHYDDNYYGKYTCDISQMTAAINNNSGFYISGT